MDERCDHGDINDSYEVNYNVKTVVCTLRTSESA